LNKGLGMNWIEERKLSITQRELGEYK